MNPKGGIYRLSILFFLALLVSLPSLTVAATHTVQVLDPRSFSPNDLTIEVGDTVRWVNASGGNSHDVTADDFSFASVTAPSFEFSRTFNSVAEILYHCTVHSSPGRNRATNQNGRINVIDSSTPAELALLSVNAVNGSYQPGETIVIDASIQNTGEQASGGFTLSLYASTDNIISSADTLLGSEQIADVGAGTTLNHQAVGIIPGGLPDGVYFIGGIITFTDSDIGNNTAFDASTVTVQAVSGQSVGCDDDFVLAAEDEFVINVSPNGIDDTVNLQCALDSAASTGMPVVRMASATYRISSLFVENLSASVEGTSKAGTTLQVLDGSIACSAMAAAGRTPAAIKFDGGDPRIQRMTIMAGAACQTGSLQTLIHFTGDSALAATCSNDVVFASVDRVDMFGPGVSGLTETAVSVHAEGNFLGGCKQTLLGTFKLNRSVVSGFPTGLVSSMRAGAQVDVNFNEFSENLVAIDMRDSNQNATITNNTINGDNTADTAYSGVLAGTLSEAAPNITRIVVNNNTFNINSTFAQASNAVVFDQQGNVANISTVISNNRFNLDGSSTTGVFSTDVNKGHISANRFSGNGLAGVTILAEQIQVSGWTVTSNVGFAAFDSSSADVVFGINTGSCILGAGQGATFTDLGIANTVLNDGDELTKNTVADPELSSVSIVTGMH